MSYVNWTKRLAGEKVPTFLQPGLDDEGYYRKPLTEMVLGRDGKTNGQRRVIDWIPIAYFISDFDQKLVGVIGSGEGLRDMTDDEVTDESLWSWVCRNPVPYETYVAVADKGTPWPDLPKPVASPQPIVTDNTIPSKTRQDYQDEIEQACASAPNKVESKEDVAAAEGIRNRIAELRLEADKVGKAIYQPMHAAYSKAQKAWSGMVKTAEAHEGQIDKIVRIWREKERQRIMVEEARIAREAAEEVERNERAADRAIARGEEPEAPEVTEEVAPPVPEPIIPDYGKPRRQEMKTFVTIEDEAKVAAYFRGNAELVAVLQKLAERAVKLGQEVPGTTTRQGYA